MIKETEKGIILSFKISPNSSKNEFIKNGEEIKIKITSPPVDGKANKCLIEFLSKTFKVPKTSIEIIKGETSKEKTILIKILDAEKAEQIKSFVNSI